MDNRTLIKWVGWWMFNTSFEDFMAFCASNGLTHKSVIDENWDKMRSNPMCWWLDIDGTLQQAVIDAAIKKYSN